MIQYTQKRSHSLRYYLLASTSIENYGQPLKTTGNHEEDRTTSCLHGHERFSRFPMVVVIGCFRQNMIGPQPYCHNGYMRISRCMNINKALLAACSERHPRYRRILEGYSLTSKTAKHRGKKMKTFCRQSACDANVYLDKRELSWRV